MIWFYVIAAAICSCVMIYFKRYTSQKQIEGLFLVQFYYLMFATPIISVALINLGLEVIKRPTVQVLPIPETMIFSFYVFAVIFGTIGSGIHSTSTSVYEVFIKERVNNAFYINQIFHGPLSHNMIYLGGVGVLTFISMLEINHPIEVAHTTLEVNIILGLVLGVLISLGIIWSSYIRPNMWGAFIGSLVLLNLIGEVHNLEQYPMLVISTTILTTSFLILACIVIIFTLFKSVKKKFIKWFFPRGYATEAAKLTNN
jgi:hypothetical protein